MKLPDSLVSGLVVVAVGCAVVSTALAVKRELSPKLPPISATPRSRPVPDWRDYDVGGHLIGSETAKVHIVEFSDFECPYCAKAAVGVLKDLRARYPEILAIRYRELPLPSHRFAKPAAKAAYCAGDQGKFVELHDVLFAKQDSLGLKTFMEFGRAAGVPDMQKFAACLARPGEAPGLAEDSVAAGKLDIRGTPAFLINGTLKIGVPDSAFMEAEIRKALGATR